MRTKKAMRAVRAFLVTSLPHDGPDVVDADLAGVDPAQLGHGVGDLVLLLGRPGVGLDPDDVAARDLDLGVAQAEGPELVAGLGHRDAGRLDLPRGAALEVDAVVEALGEQGEQAGGDDHGRGDEPDAGPADEVERRLAVVEAVAEGAALGVPAHDCGLTRRRRRPGR